MTVVGKNYLEQLLLPSMNPLNKYYVEKIKSNQTCFSLNADERGIIVNLRYLVDYRNGSSTKAALQREVLIKFDENADIKFGALVR